MTALPVWLTPGPLTTSEPVKTAMLRDWGSRDREFAVLTRKVMDDLLWLANAGPAYTAVLLQGSGTFAVEAMLGSLAPRGGRLLVPVNGSYGQRMAAIAKRLGLSVAEDVTPASSALDPERLRRLLRADKSIRAVAVVHCETGCGLLNPLDSLARVAISEQCELFVDSMSGFGALPVDAAKLQVTALASSANKCLQGVPGLSFVISRKDALRQARGQSPSLVLDLEAQSAQFEADGQWRFTPPTHVVAALAEALAELAREGGPAKRLARYQMNMDILMRGMSELGFRPFLAAELQAPIIAAFREPSEAWYSFPTFYEALRSRGFAIYSGKLAEDATFRVGTIGAVDAAVIRGFLAAVSEVVAHMSGREALAGG